MEYDDWIAEKKCWAWVYFPWWKFDRDENLKTENIMSDIEAEETAKCPKLFVFNQLDQILKVYERIR